MKMDKESNNSFNNKNNSVAVDVAFKDMMTIITMNKVKALRGSTTADRLIGPNQPTPKEGKDEEGQG